MPNGLVMPFAFRRGECFCDRREAWQAGVAGEEEVWQVQQAHQVEQALRSQAGSMGTIGRAVAAVRQDVQPGSLPDASFLVAAAEGILFEGLACLLRQVALPLCPSLHHALLFFVHPCG